MESEQAGRGVESNEAAGGEAHAPDDARPESTGVPAQPTAVTSKPPAGSSSGKHSTLAQWLPLAILICGALAAPFLYLKHRQSLLGGIKTGAEQVKDILTGAPPPDPYAEAVLKIEEDRGEPAGRKAEVEIPPELKQYSEARRFLAIQGAAASEAGVHSPHDFAELAGMIADRRELVEVPRLGRGFVLYGVGLTATGALTHYDLKAKKVAPLYANVEELEAAERGLVEERERLSNGLHEIEVRLKELGRKEREARAQLLADSAARKKELTAVSDKEKLLAAYYGKPGAKTRAKTGERLFAEYAALDKLARDFGGRSYDLHDPASSREFQARMLSHVRPAALAMLEELGTAYESKFGRRLPVTSLVRTEEYQRLLRESGNPNAADVAPPPHTTGFAFDVYYHYMTAAEQEFVMSEIARLERAGRVEALRELRDHYHVFVFADGRPPPAESVDKILGRRTKQAQPDKPEKAEKRETKGKKR
ncbi:MAG: hypothetical protein QOH49_1853 [Acidobacteriota bacterium]|nr:hypothetical protein [Acidobacteriota bacterium]